MGYCCLGHEMGDRLRDNTDGLVITRDNIEKDHPLPIDLGHKSFAGGRIDQVSEWPLLVNLLRVIWMAVSASLFRYSFHNMYGFRNALLRLFGQRSVRVLEFGLAFELRCLGI